MVVSTVQQLPQYTTVLAQAMSPCGSWFAAATAQGKLAVWSLAGLRESCGPTVRLETGGAVYSLASTERHLLVGGRDSLRGWDWTSLSQSSSQSPEPAWQISLPGRGEVNCMSVLADEGAEDRVVLGMGDNNLHLVALEAGSVVRVLSGHTGYLHSVAASPGLVASGGEGEVRLWDTRQPTSVHSLSPGDNTDLARPALGR